MSLLVSTATLAVATFTGVSLIQVRSDQNIQQQGQITDRFNAAVQNLGSNSVDIRLGGIYALQRIIQDSPRDQPTIVNLLCSYIRLHVPSSPRNGNENANTNEYGYPHILPFTKDLPAPAADVNAALSVIGGRDPARDGSSKVDLSGLDLMGANLSGAHLHGAELSGTRLAYANLDHADLTNADLADMDLEVASFDGANLQHSDVASTDLRAAFFDDADLRHVGDLQLGQLLSATLTPSTKLPPELAGNQSVIDNEHASGMVN